MDVDATEVLSFMWAKRAESVGLFSYPQVCPQCSGHTLKESLGTHKVLLFLMTNKLTPLPIKFWLIYYSHDFHKIMVIISSLLFKLTNDKFVVYIRLFTILNTKITLFSTQTGKLLSKSLIHMCICHFTQQKYGNTKSSDELKSVYCVRLLKRGHVCIIQNAWFTVFCSLSIQGKRNRDIPIWLYYFSNEI